jgi:hypothetical protein
MTVGAGPGALTGTLMGGTHPGLTDGSSIGGIGGYAANWGEQAQTSLGTVLVVEQRGRASIGAVRWGGTSIGTATERSATSIVTTVLFLWVDGEECLP